LKALRTLFEVPFSYLTIFMMTISSASEVSSFTKLFSDDMKEEFIKVKDMVQILLEDQRESVQLRAQLLAMQEEKEAILQRLHDMEL